MIAEQIRLFVVRPALQHIGLHSPAAENLVVGTGLVESGYQAIDQFGNDPAALGPAVGFWQMERLTHDDIWVRAPVTVSDLLARWPAPFEQMASNAMYAAAMCRLKYRLDRRPLPDARDPWGMALYHKRVYNSIKGATDPLHSVDDFAIACGGGAYPDSRKVGDV